MKTPLPSPLPASPGCWQWKEGAFSPCNSLTLWDRGFRYGMALFETIAVRNGCARFVREHLESFVRACHGRGWALPTILEPHSDPMPTNGILRLYCTAGEGTLESPITKPGLYCLWEPQEFNLKESYRLHVHAAPHQPLFGGLKTANYWAHIEALSQARANGCDEALLFSNNGLLISASMANVFVLIDGTLHTPEESCGPRKGVIRQWVHARRHVEPSRLTRADLNAAQEIFVTNSRIGIMPVSAFAQRPMASTLFASELRNEYERAIAS